MIFDKIPDKKEVEKQLAYMRLWGIQPSLIKERLHVLSLNHISVAIEGKGLGRLIHALNLTINEWYVNEAILLGNLIMHNRKICIEYWVHLQFDRIKAKSEKKHIILFRF